jgi:hydroxypyruvate isomerase
MMFQDLPFLDRFAAASKAGFRGVEFLFPYAVPAPRLAEVARAAGVEVVLFNMPPGDWDKGDRGTACDPRRRAELQEGVGRAVEYARVLGTRQIHCMAGLRPAGVAEEQLRETYLANLAYAGRELARHDLTLLIEAINTRDIPGFYLNTSRQAVEVMDAARIPNLRFQYDVYHMQIVEGDLTKTLERLMPRIGHVQIADVPGRNEPGTGEINYPYVFRRLDELGYQGWVGCEYRPAGGAAATVPGLGWAHGYLETR